MDAVSTRFAQAQPRLPLRAEAANEQKSKHDDFDEYSFSDSAIPWTSIFLIALLVLAGVWLDPMHKSDSWKTPPRIQGARPHIAAINEHAFD